MKIVTRHKGVEYIHSDYTTAAKRKNLPEPVKQAIMGKDYVEPTQTEEPAETQEQPIAE